MCRFAAFVGTSRPLSTLLYDPPHSLERQAFAPERLTRGHVNVDGTGVAWWPEGESEPLRYVTERPPWSDPNLAALSRRLQATTALAAVRSATPGIPFGSATVQPFVLDGHAFAHNGWIGGWRTGVGRDLVDRLPDDLHAELDTFNDSKALFLHVMAMRRGGSDLLEAVVGTATLAGELARKRGESAALNLTVATAGQVVAVRSSRSTPHNSLFLSSGQLGHCLASEPLDDAELWSEVPEEFAIEIQAGTSRTQPTKEIL